MKIEALEAPLSEGEEQVLALVEIGYSIKEIALQLFRAEKTIEARLTSARRKLDAKTTAQAIGIFVHLKYQTSETKDIFEINSQN